MQSISIVVPTLNEQGNVTDLVKRLDAVLGKNKITYEAIFIDDHSTDDTWNEIIENSKNFPVKGYKKQGKPGKAYSLLEGFNKAKYPTLAIIDADLQYPPEAIPEMMKQIESGNDIVVAQRTQRKVSISRQVFSHSFRFIFGKLLHGLTVDVQSGLKVFKKEIVERTSLNPSRWTFDLEFLLSARNSGYVIGSYPIVFSERASGVAKVNLLKTSWEIGKNAFLLKLSPSKIIPFHKSHELAESGFHFKGKAYATHNHLNPYQTSLYSFTGYQKLMFLILMLALVIGLIFFFHQSLLIIVSLITTIYFIDLIYNIFLQIKGFHSQDEITISDSELSHVNDSDLPIYTILCPMYKEANVLGQFVNAINEIDYPKEKLQVLLLLEEDDKETIQAAQNMALPKYFEITIVPYSLPKTKPKACNYGLKKAKGDFIVIYDAEDQPDKLQLKKVVEAFKSSKPSVGCIQAKLYFYNPHQNVLTRMFTAEYALWFDLTLNGLQSTNAPIPLGGTSNHFPAWILKKVSGWDAFNVTEDCELGIRLAKAGFTTSIINSTTLEEANSDLKNWFNQRTRWIKGYIQTYFVHNRKINNTYTQLSVINKLSFHLLVGGKILCLIVNPVMWIISISYFLFRATLGPFIESLFISPVFYMGIAAMILGNFMYFYSYMIACSKRGRYDLIKYMFLIPMYWLYMSAAAWVAVYRLIKSPHHWSKTLHGLHLQQPAKKMQIHSPNLTFSYDIH